MKGSVKLGKTRRQEMKLSKSLTILLAIIIIGVFAASCGGCGCNNTTPPPDNGGETKPPDDGGKTGDDILVVPGMESSVKLNIGDVIPDLKFKLNPVSAGEESSLYQIMADRNAKALVLDFWAVWCEPCKEELPYLELLHREYKEKGLVVLAATIDPYEDEVAIFETLEGTNDNKIKKSWKKLGEFELIDGQAITMSIPVDGDRAMSKALGVTSIPRTFLIDKDHKLFYQHTGFDEGKVNELKAKVKEIMGE